MTADILPASFAYIDCDIPPQMTLTEWRRRPGRHRPSAVRRLRRRTRAALQPTRGA